MDAIVDLGPAAQQSAETIARGLFRCRDHAFRTRLARAAQTAVDGNGRARVARTLMAAINQTTAGVCS